jgi:hemoglobin-like flavoprotein
MNNEQINLVKTSFEKIEPYREMVAVLFYERLFQIEPELRRLFKSDLGEQGKKLMQMIGLAVRGLDRIEELVPAVQNLGMRHASYGVEDRHYETVAKALLWTLEKVLVRDFTAETKEAWTAVYKLLAETMQNAGNQPTKKLAVVV